MKQKLTFASLVLLGAFVGLWLFSPRTVEQAWAQAVQTVRVIGQNGTSVATTSNPVPVSGSFTPSGTQDVNLTQVAGVATKTGAGTASGAIRVELPTDGTGVVNLGPSTHTQTAALAASLTVKGSAGTLYGFEVSADSTLSAAAWWIMIFDATSLPVDGAVTPAKCYALPLGATSASYAFTSPATFGTGIVVGVSTNGCFTKAASAHAFIGADFK